MSDVPLSFLLDIVGNVSAVGLVVIFVWFIWTGRVIPHSTVDFLATERDERFKDLRREADQWRQAAELKAEEVTAMRQQVDMLLEQAEVTVELLQAIKSQAG